ncbi:hypothetical protein MMC16_006674 [Acarospora aff. strigata]|nr:hypothetical protein [Acarospora aff. strigata]
MSLQTAADIPLQITSENASAERRVTPSWTVAQLKTKLEPVTGIPPSAQKLVLKLPDQNGVVLEAEDEESVRLGRWPLQPYAEIIVTDTRPPAARLHLPDPTSVPKYTMPASEYATRSDSVLAWKKANKLGRFDPHAADAEAVKKEAAEREIAERGIAPGKRCRLISSTTDTDSTRRGTILYIGPLPSISHAQTFPPSDTPKTDNSTPTSTQSQLPWIGISLDEPLGRNDGTLNGTKYFDSKPKHGIFVRPERVDVGDWPVLDEFADDGDGGDMEEI